MFKMNDIFNSTLIFLTQIFSMLNRYSKLVLIERTASENLGRYS